MNVAHEMKDPTQCDRTFRRGRARVPDDAEIQCKRLDRTARHGRSSS
jgi:hypothetical protein